MGRLYTYSSDYRSHNFGSLDLQGATITKEFSQWHSMRTVRMDALHFMRAYTLLKNDNQRSMGGCFSTAGHADVVNLAFALELFLKSLLYGVGIKPTQSHNLKKLFEKLPADLQQNIRLNFRL